MTAIPLYPKVSPNAFTLSLYLTMCIILSQGVVEVLLNTTANDPPFPESTYELPQGASVEDTTFELHIRHRVIIYSMLNFLKGVRDSYIREHTFFLLCSTLCLMLDVPTAAAYLQENENDGPPIFVWLLDMAANIRRTS